MRIEELKDKPVIGIAEGSKLGTVEDFLLDDSYLQIAGLVVGGGGLFGGHRKAIAYSAVRGIGPDAVMVSGRDAVAEVRDGGPLGVTHKLDELRQEVMSEGGLRLGRVEDADFDPQTGSVTDLWFVPESGADAYAIARNDIVSMSAEMAVVKHTVVERGVSEEPETSRARALGQVLPHEVSDAPESSGASISRDEERVSETRPADAPLP